MISYEQRTSPWLQLVSRGPEAVVSAIQEALTGCPAEEVRILRRQVLAFLCGPRLAPQILQSIVRVMTAGTAVEFAALAGADPELTELRKRRVQLERQRDSLFEHNLEAVERANVIASLTKQQGRLQAELRLVQTELLESGCNTMPEDRRAD